MFMAIKWNLWNYLLDRECLRNDCWTDEEYIIVWDWQHRVPRSYSSTWQYTAWDWIEIKNWVISVKKEEIPTVDTVEEMVEDKISDAVTEIESEIEELKLSNPEEVKFLYVQMDWDKETTENNAWITSLTDAIPTWISWSPNGIVEYYVGDWYITIRSSENENGIVRFRLSKPKADAFLNSI